MSLEWSYITVGGSLLNTEQKNLAFGVAASMVHPATAKTFLKRLSIDVSKIELEVNGGEARVDTLKASTVHRPFQEHLFQR
ncbi:hypothetical protein CTI12_AA241830 [Artemisia annua]|uniref:Uncharacterized protein n=1 Tax=Artemisia annua TaxID=35608 RepID=A0A2U1NPS6_ARTAN|nr:hypothetical protein CTI12_AA241830 [Artemisia annua]